MRLNTRTYVLLVALTASAACAVDADDERQEFDPSDSAPVSGQDDLKSDGDRRVVTDYRICGNDVIHRVT